MNLEETLGKIVELSREELHIVRKRVEEIFGWLKTVGLMRKTRHRGLARVGWMFTFATAVYNLVRIRNLAAETG